MSNSFSVANCVSANIIPGKTTGSIKLGAKQLEKNCVYVLMAEVQEQTDSLQFEIIKIHKIGD